MENQIAASSRAALRQRATARKKSCDSLLLRVFCSQIISIRISVFAITKALLPE